MDCSLVGDKVNQIMKPSKLIESACGKERDDRAAHGQEIGTSRSGKPAVGSVLSASLFLWWHRREWLQGHHRASTSIADKLL